MLFEVCFYVKILNILATFIIFLGTNLLIVAEVYSPCFILQCVGITWILDNHALPSLWWNFEFSETNPNKTFCDVAPPKVDTTPRTNSSPSGPMTRKRAKAIHDKVNSLLSTLNLDTPLNGVLLRSNVLCVLRNEL
jgi:hypothetical protein